MGQSIHIALTFDDNFWAPAYATMRSVCLATTRREDLVFHLCTLGLTSKHAAKLECIGDEFGARVHMHRLDDLSRFRDLTSGLKTSRRLPEVVYARLFLDHILDRDIRRVVYLDCDTFVRAPIEEIAERDLEGHPIAAVQEYLAALITGGRDIKSNRDLFDTADPYFNSGVLVIDMSAWRNADLPGRLRQAAADGTMDRIYYDQDFLNLVFKNDWLQLDGMWNVVDPRPHHHGMPTRILHYTTNRKPWNIVSVVAFARVYRHVMTNEVFYQFLRERMRRRLRPILPLRAAPLTDDADGTVDAGKNF